ncbi:MAG: SDR family NAD(P)-dependent oxidoreductase [Rhodospirillales bacterium]|nr:SDR family NAD(P)-dependent oxidoreductase [Rhodospirillales bacterium]
MASSDSGVAVVIGAGGGLGAGLARRFASAGMVVAVASRNPHNAEEVAAHVESTMHGNAYGYPCDATDEVSIHDLLNRVSGELGEPDLVVYNASGFLMKSILDIEVDEMVAQWNVTCLGGFIVGREAARRMTERGSGTIIFTGATACYKGSALFAGFAVGKFGLRGLAQSMARELGPKGVHVALVNIDGEINGPAHIHEIPGKGIDALLDSDATAETYLSIHRQHHTAWTHEVDLRPAIERW